MYDAADIVPLHSSSAYFRHIAIDVSVHRRVFSCGRRRKAKAAAAAPTSLSLLQAAKIWKTNFLLYSIPFYFSSASTCASLVVSRFVMKAANLGFRCICHFNIPMPRCNSSTLCYNGATMPHNPYPQSWHCLLPLIKLNMLKSVIHLQDTRSTKWRP